MIDFAHYFSKAKLVNIFHVLSFAPLTPISSRRSCFFWAQILPIFKCPVVTDSDSNAIVAVSIFRQLLVLFFTFKGVLISLSSVCSCQSHLKTEQCLFFFPIINKSLQASLKPKKNKDHLDSVF